jgi:hypothetical protein
VDRILSIVFWATRDLPVARHPNLHNSRSKQDVNPGSGPLEVHAVELLPMGTVPSSQKKKERRRANFVNRSHVSMCPFRYKSIHCCSLFFFLEKGFTAVIMFQKHGRTWLRYLARHTEYIIQHTEYINSVHWNRLKLGTSNFCHNGELCMFAEH